MKEGFLIIDVGTGNVRVGITDTSGIVVHLERDNVQYVRDQQYPDALYFEPNQLWLQIEGLIKKSLAAVKGQINIIAITASSQREGIVVLDSGGKALLGLPNHDHRGREWEGIVKDKTHVYNLTGRYPGSLFSALKLVGIKMRLPDLYHSVSTMLSISDWVQFQLTGVPGYEHAQASETILYDVEQKSWSAELCDLFEIEWKILPPLHASGTILGNLLPSVRSRLNLPAEAVVVVGGADTQLAIKSTGAQVNDFVIVSGTTTPVTMLVDSYITDEGQRTWTNRYVNDQYYILETNAGVTGLNYQRLKNIFYPKDSYDVIESELSAPLPASCVASLGSLIAGEKRPILQGGFFFDIPVPAELTRADFMRATLWDMACCIKINYDILQEISGGSSDFVWACGGGFQSRTLRGFIASLIGKPLRIREGFHQASIAGGATICSEALKKELFAKNTWETILPDAIDFEIPFKKWKQVRMDLQEKQLGGAYL